MSDTVIGWVGLGEMGVPMAGNLVSAGYAVVGYDLSQDRLADGVEVGVEPLATLAELVERSTVIITMVRTGAQTEQVLDHLVEAGATGTVIVMSTMDPVSMAALAERVAANDIIILDIPVSGGVRGAEAATLSIMASGPRAELDAVLPLLDVLGARTHRLGDRAGASQAAKLANQVMMAVGIAGAYEGLRLARDYGVEPAGVIAAVGDGTGASWPLAHWDWMTSLWEEYVPDNALDILDKDMKAVVAAIASRELDLPVISAAHRALTDLWDGARDDAARRRVEGRG